MENENISTYKRYNTNEINRTIIENENIKVSTFRRILPQFLAGSAKNLLLFDLGTMIGYQTIIIGNLLGANGQLSFTENESSWFASLLFICEPVGCLLSPIFLESLGRKKTMMILNLPLFLVWLIIATAGSIPVLYIGSVLAGLSLGFIEAPTITYIGEISEAKLRSIMTSYATLSVCTGMLAVFFLGVIYDWRTIAYACTCIPVISVIAIAFIPESPIWLLAHGRTDDAEKALCWLRGWVKPHYVQKEFSELVLYKNNKILKKSDKNYAGKNVNLQNEGSENTISVVNASCDYLVNEDQDERKSIKEALSDLREPTMRRALFLMHWFFFFTATSGTNIAQTYAIPLFEELGLTLDPYKANVLTAISNNSGLVTLMIFVKFFGKRNITLFSVAGCVVTCIAIGYCALYPGVANGDSLWSILFIIYTANNFMYGLGLGPVPWMYVSEVFPFRGRGLAAGITASSYYVYRFCIIKAFFIIKNTLSLSGSFFLYGFISFVGLIYLYFFLPETEGKTLQDIEASSEKIKKTKL